MPNFPQLDGDCVFHYRSGSALLNMLQKDRIVLWLTCAGYLNDTLEGTAIFKHVETVCKKLLENGKLNGELCKEILNISASNCQEAPAFYRKDNDEYNLDYKKCDVYTMSFSTEPDSLPMWNYYAGYGGCGYCVHFNKDILEKFFPTQFECFCILKPIVYSEDIEKELNEEFSWIAQESDVREAIQKVKDYLSLERYFYKDTAFAHEKEYRLLLAIPRKSERTFDIKFRAKDGYIIPYIEVELTDFNHTFGMIKGVTIGPLANKELAVKGMKAFLEQRGYSMAAKNIQTSNIPVRY